LPKIVSEQVSQIIDDKSEEVKRQSNVFGVPENEEGLSVFLTWKHCAKVPSF
jgi:hypothetical protein